MDSKLLLVESILLLYRESQLPEGAERSTELVNDVINMIQVPEATMETSSGRDTIVSLKGTLTFMQEQPSTYKFSKDNLLQKLRINVGDERYLYEVIKDGMEDYDDMDQIQEACRGFRNGLRSTISKKKVTDILKDASSKLMFQGDQVNWKTFVSEIQGKLEPYTSAIATACEDGKVDEIDLADQEEMESTIQEAQKEASNDGIMRLGWQGLNRMTGDHGGLRRGDTILIGALQHNFKSGMLMNIPKQVAMYNKPHMIDPSKKPLILYISLENNVSDNLLQLYAAMKGQETKEAIDPRTASNAEAATYIREQVSKNGYHFKMARFNGSEFTYRSFFDLMDRYQAEGYEIHMVSLDYLLMMSIEGCTGTNDAHAKRDLLRRLRNYCNPKKITLVTAAQLSTEAKSLVRNGVDEFVKEIANKGYYDGCKALDNEVDLELNIHIEKPGDGFSYLTIQRGKHRRPPPMTPEKDMYTVYRFEPWGLPEDIDAKDLSRRRVGATTASDGGASAWWDPGAAPGSTEEDMENPIAA